MAEKKTAPVTTVKSEVDTMIDALVEKAQVEMCIRDRCWMMRACAKR